jgi:acyl carrier protein
MTVRNRVRDYLATTAGGAELLASLGDDDSLIDRGVLDSLGVLEMVAWLLEEFGITVDELELTADNFETVSAIISYVHVKSATTSAEDVG